MLAALCPEVRPHAGPLRAGTRRGWYRRRLDVAATRAFRLIPLSARARLSTSRWVGVRSSGVLQKERMVRLLRQRPVRAEKKGVAGVRAGEAAWGQNWGPGVDRASATLSVQTVRPR